MSQDSSGKPTNTTKPGTFDVTRALEAVRREEGPDLAAGPDSANQLVHLVTRLAEQPGSIVAVLRSYNKPGITQVLENIERLRATLPNLLGVVVTINVDPEKGDEDLQTLKAVEAVTIRKNEQPQGDSDFSVVALQISRGYSWTAGLNALPALLAQAEEQLATTLDTGLMYYSTDVEIEGSELSKLVGTYQKYGLGIGTVRLDVNPEGLVTENSIPSQSEVLEYFKGPDKYKLRYDQNKKSALQALAYSRNTLSIVALQLLKSMGGMDPACNAAGGVEDAQFWVRLMRVRPDLVEGSLASPPAKYTDTAWEELGSDRATIPGLGEITLGDGQERKLTSEANARFKNAAYLLESNNFDAGMRVPVNRQDYLI